MTGETTASAIGLGMAGQPGRWRRTMMLGLVGLAGMVIGVAIWSLTSPTPTTSTPTPQPILRSMVALPADVRMANLDRPAVALSPDGTQLAYIATSSGTAQLYLRSMGQLEANPIPDTENAHYPFFSPDGQWLGFFADGKLKKVSVSGGTPVILCDVTTPSPTASWGADDTIVFTPHTSSTIFEVPAAGGTPQPLTTLDSENKENNHRSPQILLSGKAVLFSAGSVVTGPRIVVQSLETGERRVVLEGAHDALYVPTGHLVFVQAGALMAVAFDLEQLEVKGEPIPILQGIMQVGGANGLAQLTFSDTGTLVYLPTDIAPREGRTLIWVDRQGAVQPLAAPPRDYSNPRLSPDGQQVALQINPGGQGDIWVHDIRRGTLTRLTFEQGGLPIWTPDGERITFQSSRFGTRNLFWKPADGTGAAERLLESELPNTAQSWSPDGKVLGFSEVHPNTNGDIWILPMEGEGKPELFLRTPFSETAPVFSPDGHWLAYRSNESGRYEIYVQPFPGPGGKWQISTEGGGEAAWARGGQELFYRSDDKMMAVEITTEPTFTHGTPQLLFEGQYVTYGPRAAYDVTSDGQRFLMIKEGEGELTATQINVVLNWFEELKRLVPTP